MGGWFAQGASSGSLMKEHGKAPSSTLSTLPNNVRESEIQTPNSANSRGCGAPRDGPVLTCACGKTNTRNQGMKLAIQTVRADPPHFEMTAMLRLLYVTLPVACLGQPIWRH